MEDLAEGFYHLVSKEEPEPILVHGYKCTDMGGQFVFGFNTHDGGGLVPLLDIKEGVQIIPVTISEENITVAQAMNVLKREMTKDVEPGSYAHGWHCNIAMMCCDAILAHDDQVDFARIVGNDAASRFMKLCFNVDTKGRSVMDFDSWSFRQCIVLGNEIVSEKDHTGKNVAWVNTTTLERFKLTD